MSRYFVALILALLTLALSTAAKERPVPAPAEQGRPVLHGLLPADLDGPRRSGVKAGAVELPETGEIPPSVLEKEEAVGLARVKAVEKACHVPSAFLRFSGSPTRCRR